LKAAASTKKHHTRKGYSVVPEKDDRYVFKLYIAEILNLSRIQENIDRTVDEVIKILIKTIVDTRRLLIRFLRKNDHQLGARAMPEKETVVKTTQIRLISQIEGWLETRPFI
jgi:hypothetical protein